MVKTEGPFYFLVYHTRDGPKRIEIKINPKRLCPRSEALAKLPLLVRKIQGKDKRARDFKIEESYVFKNGAENQSLAAQSLD